MRILKVATGLAGSSICVLLGDWLSKQLAGPGVANEGLPNRNDQTTGAADCSAEGVKGEGRLLVIYGASGPTGIYLTKAALAKGFRVRAFVRNPTKLEAGLKQHFKNESLEVVTGDLTDLGAVRAVVAGASVVISVAGSKPETAPGPMTAAVRAMVEGCRENGVRKLLVQNGALSLAPGERWGWFTIGNYVRAHLKYREGFATMDDNDRVMKYLYNNARDIDWVVSRPHGIEHGKRLQPLAPNVDPFRLGAIRYADLADWTLAQVDSNAYVGKMPRLYYPPVLSKI